MREILFKGKTDKNEWVEGCLLYDEENQEAFIAEYFEDKSAYIRKVIPETVGQYIGLTDKNGKKIFEGDILAYTDYYGNEQIEGVVKYGNYNCSCCNGVYGWYIDGGDIRACEVYEFYVAGNIHDNPELLKGATDERN